MTCRDLFALGVRLLGAWLIVRGFTYVEAFVDFKLYPVSDRALYSSAGHLIYATLDFGLAAFFLLWTGVIVAWTYGDEPGIEHGRQPDVEAESSGRPDDSGGPDGT